MLTMCAMRFDGYRYLEQAFNGDLAVLKRYLDEGMIPEADTPGRRPTRLSLLLNYHRAVLAHLSTGQLFGFNSQVVTIHLIGSFRVLTVPSLTLMITPSVRNDWYTSRMCSR